MSTLLSIQARRLRRRNDVPSDNASQDKGPVPSLARAPIQTTSVESALRSECSRSGQRNGAKMWFGVPALLSLSALTVDLVLDDIVRFASRYTLSTSPGRFSQHACTSRSFGRSAAASSDPQQGPPPSALVHPAGCDLSAPCPACARHLTCLSRPRPQGEGQDGRELAGSSRESAKGRRGAVEEDEAGRTSWVALSPGPVARQRHPQGSIA